MQIQQFQAQSGLAPIARLMPDTHQFVHGRFPTPSNATSRRLASGNVMKSILMLAVASMLASAALAASKIDAYNPVSERIQVELLEHQWTQAASAGDRPVLNDLLDDKFFEIFPGNIRRNKQDMLAAAPLPAGGSQILEDVRVQVLGNVAVATGINRYTPAYGYKAIEYRFTDVFVKHEEGWRVVAARMLRKGTDTV
jgi:ketosteroid isomerase-like protein